MASSSVARETYDIEYEDDNSRNGNNNWNRKRNCGIGITILFVVCVIVIVVTTILVMNNRNGSNSNNNNVSDNTDNTTPIPTFAPTSSPTAEGYQACNGIETLCDVRVNDIMFATLHNAVSTEEDGVVLLPNHKTSLENALNAGWRGINYDIGKCNRFGSTNNGIRLVHGNCALGTRDPIEVFTNIVNFLYNNKNEIILMPVQINNNLDGGVVALNEIYNVMEQVTGFIDLLYQHPKTTLVPWPTLRQLISANKRILFFHYDGRQRCNNNNNNNNNNACPPGLQYEWFNYAAETQFQFTSVSQILNTEYSCNITRGRRQDYDDTFFGVNLFTEVPLSSNCATLNAYNFVKSHIESCTAINNGLQPNALLVDCWEIGDVLDVINEYNAALIPLNIQDATLTIRMDGLSTEITGTTEEITFIEQCSNYFANVFTTLNNVYCQIISQDIEQQQQQRRRLQDNNASLVVTVEVIGDGGDGIVVTSEKLQEYIESNGNEFINMLSQSNTFFSTITSIKSVASETETTNNNDVIIMPSPAPTTEPLISNNDDNEPTIQMTDSPIIVTVPTAAPTIQPVTAPVTTSPTVLPMTDSPIIVSMPTTQQPVTSPSSQTSLTRSDEVIALILEEGWSDSTAVMTMGTPQQQAIEWIADIDERMVTIEDTIEFRERYALAVFYFATGGIESWVYQLGWLSSDVSYCSWNQVLDGRPLGVLCNEEFSVSVINLPSNGLQGEIPEEINLLYNLADLVVTGNDIVEEQTTTENNPTSSPIAKGVSPTISPTISPSTQQPIVTEAPVIAVTATPSVQPTTEMPVGQSSSSSVMLCNGHENLCDLRVNNIMYATLHNAASSADTGTAFLFNHELSLEKALEAGYRGINLDIGKCNNEITLVHGLCVLGSRDFIEVFTNIVEFLNNNPNEILIMPTQIDNDTGGDVTLSEIDDLMQNVPMLKSYMYSHDPNLPWPTLRELIEEDTRILFFHYNGEGCNESTNCPDGFHDWFYFAAESQFEINSISQFDDKDYSCTATRGNYGLRDFYGLNIFTRIPSEANCAIMNSRESLEFHIEECTSRTGLVVNLLTVDCWDVGQVLEVVSDYNSSL